MQKCELCTEKRRAARPACVRGCPNQAIVYRGEVSKHDDYVDCIGNSARRRWGALRASAARMDREGTITLLSKEADHTYSTATDFLSDLKEKPDEKRMQLPWPGSFLPGKQACTPSWGRRQPRRCDQKTQRLPADGQAIPPCMTGCCWRTGGSVPLCPPMEGLETVNIPFTFMTLDRCHGSWKQR